MAPAQKPTESAGRRLPAATTPEARENQLIALAYDRAEQQIADGTASAQVLAHFLKLGSSRERLEQKRIDREILLADSKIEQLASSKRIEELYGEAMDALRGYQGKDNAPESNGDGYED